MRTDVWAPFLAKPSDAVPCDHEASPPTLLLESAGMGDGPRTPVMPSTSVPSTSDSPRPSRGPVPAIVVFSFLL